MISDKKAKQELLWYYHQSSADIGFSSNYGSMIASAFGFQPNGNSNHAEDKFVAMASRPHSPIKKLRRIEQALRHLTPEQRKVINCLYDSNRLPPQLVSQFGIRSGAALFNTQTSIDNLITLCSNKLSKKISESEDQLLQTITKQTDELYNQVHADYRKHRD